MVNPQAQITDNAGFVSAPTCIHCIHCIHLHPTAMPAHPIDSSQTPALFWWIVGGILSLALLPTAWPGLDLWAAALFIGDAPQLRAVHWWWVELINAYVPAVFRVIVLVTFVAWIVMTLSKRATGWRLALAFVALGITIGPGLVVNSGFKDNWQRARPYQVQPFGGTQQFTRAAVMTDQCDNNCSFVSGHVACGFFLASIMLVDRRRRVLWGVTGVVSGFAIGFSRMADGAHWLSDVLWAAPITLVCSWLVWKLLVRLYTPKAGTNVGSEQAVH
jgi:lipid A 4'-phosphatase